MVCEERAREGIGLVCLVWYLVSTKLVSVLVLHALAQVKGAGGALLLQVYCLCCAPVYA